MLFQNGLLLEDSTDYNKQENGFLLNHTLSNDFMEAWSVVGLGSSTIIVEHVKGATGATITVSSLPSIHQAVKVFSEGLNQQEGQNGDYTKNGNDINFNYTLDQEDLIIWSIMGVNDNGIIGLFKN